VTSPPPFSNRRQLIGFVGWLVLTFATATIGAIASASAGAFYAELILPAWAPPGWVFGPVWTVLYILMAVSAWLVWRERGFSGARGALLLFIAQLGANALWSWLFFAWRLGGFAFAEVLLLWFLIAMTVFGFWRLKRFAAALLLPYLAWVAFASALNFAIWRLNPQLLA
jgi:benzodiazapine receptor